MQAQTSQPVWEELPAPPVLPDASAENEAEARRVAQCLGERWALRLGRSPQLALDYHYPSLSVLDIVFTPALIEGRLAEQRALVRAAGAYIALIVAELCREAGLETSFTDDTLGFGLIVKVKQETIELPILMQFSTSLAGPNEASRLGEAVIGSSVALEVAEGALMLVAAADPTVVRPHLCRAIARHYAEWYRRVYPLELWGQVAELYLTASMFDKRLERAERISIATGGLISCLVDYAIPMADLLRLSENLVVCPDGVLSSAALVCYSAVCRRRPSTRVIAVAQGRGLEPGMLRPLVLQASQMLSGANAIPSAGAEMFSPGRFPLEQALALLPCIYMDERRVRHMLADPRGRVACQALLELRRDDAVELLDDMIDENQSDLELRFQRVFLDIMDRKYDAAEAELRSIAEEDGAKKSYRYWELCGMNAMLSRGIDVAMEFFRTGLPFAWRSPVAQANMANNQAWLLMQAGQYGRAVQLLNIAGRGAEYPVTIMLNKAFCYWNVGLQEHVASLEARLLEIAPLDRRLATLDAVSNGAFTLDAPVHHTPVGLVPS